MTEIRGEVKALIAANLRQAQVGESSSHRAGHNIGPNNGPRTTDGHLQGDIFLFCKFFHKRLTKENLHDILSAGV